MPKNNEKSTTMNNKEMENTKPALLWMMLLILPLIMTMALYNLFVKGETQFVQFGMVFALLATVFRQIPALAKRKYLCPALSALSAATALILLGIEIYLAATG